MEGTTFSPEGLVKSADGKDASAELQSDPIKRLAEISALCNDAKIVFDEARCVFNFHISHQLTIMNLEKERVY